MEDAQIYGHSICDNGEEDYIELEVIDSNSITISLFHFKNSNTPPPQQEEARSSEFEFQMLPSFIDRNNITSSSTADELFYNGKLLPLDHIPLHNKFLHVGKKIVDFEQSFSTPLFQSFHVSKELNNQEHSYLIEYSTNDESSKTSKNFHVSKSFDDFDQPFCHSCHVTRKLNQEVYSTNDESSKGSKFLHVSKSFDDFDQSLSTPFCHSCHVSRNLNQEHYYSKDDESTSKTSKILHVSKSFNDYKQSCSSPFSQSCQVSRELNPQDYFFGYSTDDETSKRSKWSLTRKLRNIKQLSFDHSKLKCLINNSVNNLVSKKEFFGKIHHGKSSSFSGAIRRLLTTKSCSSSLSSSSISRSKIQEMHNLLVRNREVIMYAEVDPIQAAIAHCKNSHDDQNKKKFNSRKSNVSNDTNIGHGRSLSASRINIFEEQERIGLCRG